MHSFLIYGVHSGYTYITDKVQLESGSHNYKSTSPKTKHNVISDIHEISEGLSSITIQKLRYPVPARHYKPIRITKGSLTTEAPSLEN